MEAVGAQQVDVTKFAVLDAVEQFPAGAAVAAHQADTDLEILFLGLLIEGEHALGGDAVRADRFFHEHVQAALDRFLVMHPAEGARGGEDDHVACV